MRSGLWLAAVLVASCETPGAHSAADSGVPVGADAGAADAAQAGPRDAAQAGPWDAAQAGPWDAAEAGPADAGSSCEPACGERSCGSDGCGGSCGNCGGDLSCSAEGKCLECVPSGAGTECGEDGCGGVVGICADGQYCTEDGHCLEADGPTWGRTRYPIVLAHGMLGFKKLFGAVEYFYGVSSALKKDGATVFVTQVSEAQDSTTRGEQLLAQVQQFLAQSGATKVNLIGHSQGGLDARYVAGVHPELVASITTVGSPHQGADLATYFEVHGTDATLARAFATGTVDGLSMMVELISGNTNPNDAWASLHALSASGARELNQRFPAGLPETPCGQGPTHAGHMAFYSWTGTSVLTNPLDTSDAWLLASSLFYSEDNDGLVGRCSSHFGRVLKDDYKMNHLDEVNQFVGFTALFEVSPVDVFRDHAHRLRNAGY
jgi:triacylglycerol lipase